MMQSAFGIEHGEISKASRIPRPPGKPMRGMPGGKNPTRAQRKTKGRGGPSGPQKVAGAFHRIGAADISLKGVGTATGKGFRGVGSFLEKRPGLTGTALVGGGGAAGYKYLSDKEPKKRKP